jgi:O-6-methylguanine DNA methyltransferase
MNAWQLDYRSPMGPLRLMADEEGNLLSVRFIARDTVPSAPPGEPPSRDKCSLAEATLHQATDQLHSYFTGGRYAFELKTRKPKGFRMTVYEAIAAIPPGETRTYGEIAAIIGKPGAARAVGGALAANTLMVIVPCHRVVPASGGVGAYRDGARVKGELIALEKRLYGRPDRRL